MGDYQNMQRIDTKVSKFVNHLMYDGKKNTSYEIFYAALETVKTKLPNEEKSPDNLARCRQKQRRNQAAAADSLPKEQCHTFVYLGVNVIF